MYTLDHNKIDNLIAQAEQATEQPADRCLKHIDLTRLTDNDTEADIMQLCETALAQTIAPAGVCVYPQFIPLIKKTLAPSAIKIIAVSNFPDGHTDINQCVSTTEHAFAEGADEVDVVFPYQAYLSGDQLAALNLIEAVCATKSNHQKIKVIIETGALKTREHIVNVSSDVIAAGADFIKTSTGKVAVGATLEAACIMLSVIEYMQHKH